MRSSSDSYVAHELYEGAVGCFRICSLECIFHMCRFARGKLSCKFASIKWLAGLQLWKNMAPYFCSGWRKVWHDCVVWARVAFRGTGLDVNEKPKVSASSLLSSEELLTGSIETDEKNSQRTNTKPFAPLDTNIFAVIIFLSVGDLSPKENSSFRSWPHVPKEALFLLFVSTVLRFQSDCFSPNICVFW